MVDYDVIVAGGAVVGSRVAEYCAKAGLSTAVVEEDPVPGKYGRCTAIVSKRGLDSIGVDYAPFALNEIRGANIFAGNSSLAVRTRQAQAVVLNRFRFDAQCAGQAKEAGAVFYYNSHLTTVDASSPTIAITATRRDRPKDPLRLTAKALVGADGAHSAVASLCGFPRFAAGDLAKCWEGEYGKACVGAPDLVDVYVDTDFARGFFGWAVPCGKDCVRLGFGTTGNGVLLGLREKFLAARRVSTFLPPGSQLARDFSAVIPLRPRAATQKGNVLLVGDAAGQAKASTGGGIVFGSRCAKVAADEIVAFVKGGKTMGYERAWRKKYGGTLAAHRKIRSLMDRIEGRWNPRLLRIGRALGMGFALERFGDMDEIIKF
jgi:geranylgeranyl reductase family protein